ncbi:MAG: hypothetical protein KDI06_18475 [Calditrichaeota bacterium]|nr:hypothetical protein [Calditrichota bacterium]HQU73818.1 DUF6157 family protein [Calditrichia bacterium]
MHSTNYFNTFIEVAEDCPALKGQVPPEKGEQKSVANLQYEMVAENPYVYTSDDVLFTIHARRKEIPEDEWAEAREIFFSRGQACFRASPLPKRYGWGVHSDKSGKIAIYGVESDTYRALVADNAVAKTRAMRSKRK